LGPGQSKVRQFQFARPIDQQILRLQVPMQNPTCMAIGQTAKQLHKKQFDIGNADLHYILIISIIYLFIFIICFFYHSIQLLHVFAQIAFHKFEHQRQHTIRVNNVMQGDNLKDNNK
jgi:hypothetical protein